MKKLIIAFLAVALICGAALARQPQRGYRGFIDWSNNLRSEKYQYELLDGAMFTHRTTFFYTGISTSHGYQFNPLLFVGGGLDIEYNSKLADYIFAPFAHVRTDFKFNNFTPFAEARLGYAMRDGGGVYFSPNIGYRFNWGRKMGVNVGLGLTLLGYHEDYYSIATGGDIFYDDVDIIEEHYSGCRAFFSFRIGIDC